MNRMSAPALARTTWESEPRIGAGQASPPTFVDTWALLADCRVHRAFLRDSLTMPLPAPRPKPSPQQPLPEPEDSRDRPHSRRLVTALTSCCETSPHHQGAMHDNHPSPRRTCRFDERTRCGPTHRPSLRLGRRPRASVASRHPASLRTEVQSQARRLCARGPSLRQPPALTDDAIASASLEMVGCPPCANHRLVLADSVTSTAPTRRQLDMFQVYSVRQRAFRGTTLVGSPTASALPSAHFAPSVPFKNHVETLNMTPHV